MLTRFRRDPLIGNVLGLIAVFIALGAGAYAAGLAPNSVKSKHIANGQVKNPDLAAASVTSLKIAPGAILSALVPADELSGDDIDESTLGTVPNATNAANATTATNAADAADADLLDGKDSTQFQGLGSAAWTPLTLNNLAAPIACNWTNFGAGFFDAAYFRDQDGMVHLRGVVRANDGIGIGAQSCGSIAAFDEFIGLLSLPSGYTPQQRQMFTVSSNNKPARVDVFANGSIGLTAFAANYPAFADMKVFVSLDGISFRCGPSGSNGCP